MSRLYEQNKREFKCIHCHRRVSAVEFIGTRHRNHCPFCLWSKHVDLKKAGDRKATCDAGMEPIGLTFKQAGVDNYGELRQGELMVIHRCTNKSCNKISINRIAGDDNPPVIIEVFKKSQGLGDNLRKEIVKMGINLLTKNDEKQIRIQLFGKN